MTDELDPNYENVKQIARLNAEIALESDEFAFNNFSPSEFECEGNCEHTSCLAKTITSAFTHNPINSAPTKITVLYNGNTDEWEAWEDGDNEPMYRHKNVLEVVDHCVCDYDIIEVHNND